MRPPCGPGGRTGRTRTRPPGVRGAPRDGPGARGRGRGCPGGPRGCRHPDWWPRARARCLSGNGRHRVAVVLADDQRPSVGEADGLVLAAMAVLELERLPAT